MAERLNQALDFAQPSGDGPVYHGHATADGFRLKTPSRARNDFLPVIEGAVTRRSPGAQVEITMKPELSAILFQVGWLGLVIYLGGQLFFNSLDSGDDPLGVILPPLLFVFGLVLPNALFWPAARKARADLLARLSAF